MATSESKDYKFQNQSTHIPAYTTGLSLSALYMYVIFEQSLAENAL